MGNKKPRVLILDIETAPVLAYIWKLWDENIGLNQIKSDWYVLSWAAKWLGDPPSKVMYDDQRGQKNLEDDSRLLKGIWDLLNQADVIVTQNGNSFDTRKLNARFILNGFQPPSTYRRIDTFRLAQKHFGFTSHKLEYMTDKLCKKYKKLKHHKFSGFDLWKEVLAGNPSAWREMEKYNKNDVLSLEELYTKLIPWDSSIDFNVYHDNLVNECKCGSTVFQLNGFYYTNTGKFQRIRCVKCGCETHEKNNLLTRSKRKSLARGTAR